jgi:hypothetical protein
MKARHLPFLLIALLAPLLVAIALHRSGLPLLQEKVRLEIAAADDLRGPAELRATYRATRCIPWLTCQRDWSGGPRRPIEMEKRRLLQLGQGLATVEVPKALLSIAGFRLVGLSLRVGSMASAGRADLLFAEAAGSAPPDEACRFQARGADLLVQGVPRGCARLGLSLGGAR